jgi:hypothetical protein
VATTAIERKAAIKSIVVRFCANLFIKNRQNQNLRISFCVFTRPRPGTARLSAPNPPLTSAVSPVCDLSCCSLCVVCYVTALLYSSGANFVNGRKSFIARFAPSSISINSDS